MNREGILESLKNENVRKSVLPTLTQNNDQEIIQEIIKLFDDEDIEIRGEVFSTLFLNENNILKDLVLGLKNDSKNVRAYTMLVLANRNEKNAVNFNRSKGGVMTEKITKTQLKKFKKKMKALKVAKLNPDATKSERKKIRKELKKELKELGLEKNEIKTLIKENIKKDKEKKITIKEKRKAKAEKKKAAKKKKAEKKKAQAEKKKNKKKKAKAEKKKNKMFSLIFLCIVSS